MYTYTYACYHVPIETILQILKKYQNKLFMETFSVKRIKNIESKNFPFHVESTTTFTKMFAFITTLKVSKTIKFLFSRQDASKGNVFLFVCFIEKLKICIYFLSFLLDIKLDCLYH